jgi:RNA 2',3'-cyclic 3'-phosphodiesterase
MRLFVAIVPPAEVLGELAAAVAPLRAARPGLRWTGPPDWHLTLAFLGEVTESVLAGLSVRLERAAGRHPAQPLAIRGAGAFPRAGRATVLWAGVEADTGALAALAASVAAGARRAGAPPPDEGRRYRPHITLARCREPASVGDLTAAIAGFASTGWVADDIRLIRSNLRSEPRYDELGRWRLRSVGHGGTPGRRPV